MNKTARQVFRICATAHNIRRIPRNAAWPFYSHTAVLSYSSSSNTHSKNNGSILVPQPFGRENDVVQHALSTAKTCEDIFSILNQNRSSLKSRHWFQAFKVVNGLRKLKYISDLSGDKKSELLQLCELLKRHIRMIKPNDAVYILYVLNNLGVPSTSIIVQSLLQLIRTSLSQLSFRCLATLHYQLKDFQSTPLSDALKIAVPIMCEIQLKNKMIDLSDVWQLVSALQFLRNNSDNEESIIMIVDALRENGSNLTVSQAQLVFRYLCDLQYSPVGYEEVLTNVRQILIKSIPFMTFANIRSLVKKTVSKVVYKKDVNFYNEELLDSCAKTVISKDFGFQQGVEVLRFLHMLRHTHLRLIDYLAAKCFEDPSNLSSSYYNLVIGLAQADYKPIFWESMQEIILKNRKKEDLKYQATAMQFALSLAVFDCYDKELTKDVFSEHFLDHLYSTKAPHIDWNLLVFYQSVKTLHPSYTGPWPAQYRLKDANKANGPFVTNSSLLPILENAMGGPQYVLSNWKTKLGHHIDHVVVMRKGGYPVAVNLLTKVPEEDSDIFIENLQLPDQSQVILILNIPALAYAVNSRRLKGDWGLMIRTLETHTGHSVIPISSIMWNELMDREKTPYLMQAIRLKCDSELESANVR